MKRRLQVWSVVLFLALSLAIFSCSGKKAEEMYETAQFEELQKNYPHARQLYEEIMKEFPESDFSNKASERLKALKDKP